MRVAGGWPQAAAAPTAVVPLPRRPPGPKAGCRCGRRRAAQRASIGHRDLNWPRARRRRRASLRSSDVLSLCRPCTRGSPSIRKLPAVGGYMHACKGEQAPARGLGDRPSPLGSTADLSYGALGHSYTNCAGRRPASAICAACSALHGRTTGARAACTASAPLTPRRSWTHHARSSFCTQPGPRGAAPGGPRTRTPAFLRWKVLRAVPSTLFAH